MDDGLKKLIDEYLELREVGTIERPKQELILRCEGQDIASLGTGASLEARRKLVAHVLENLAKKAIVVGMINADVEVTLKPSEQRVDFVIVKGKVIED